MREELFMCCRKVIGTFALIAVLYIPVYSQEECEIALAKATEEFNAGHFSDVPSILKDCLSKRQSADWRQRAYLLLAETYLLLEDPIGADESYLRILRANPEFETVRGREPIDLVYLSSKFTAAPIFALYGKLGANVSPVWVINDVDIGGEAYTSEKYKLKFGWHAGVGLDYFYSNKIGAAIELNYNYSSFVHETQNLFGQNRDVVEFQDKQSMLSLPLMIKYTDDKGKYRPYGYLGYSLNFLLSDNANITIKNRDSRIADDNITSEDKISPTLSFTDKRVALSRSLLVGGGVRYKRKLDYFFIDLRYSLGLTNMVNASNRYSEVNQRWAYVDDDFRLDNLSIAVGFVRPFYSPRKLKKSKSKSVLRKLKNDENSNK